MTLLAWTLALFSFAPSATTDSLTVTLNNIQGSEGKIVVQLYDSADSFMNTPIHTATATPDSATASVTFNDLEYGTYAIIVLHDKNDNGEMDMGPGGIPDEGYAFSSGAGAMGPPNFSAAKFAFAANKRSHDIRMIYW
ncbi:MAG: DUF2141 domain-containing protein [Bacteroidota bacterium]